MRLEPRPAGFRLSQVQIARAWRGVMPAADGVNIISCKLQNASGKKKQKQNMKS